VGTVSRVLNHHPNVNDAARERVLKAAQQLGYKRIRTHRRNGTGPESAAVKGNVGLIFFGMEDALVHLPVVSAALHGVEGALSARGENLMLANIPRGNQVPAFLRDRGVVGLILKGPNQGQLPSAAESELIDAIEGLPHVWLMGRLANARGDHCNFDADAAGQLVAAHLHEQGHRRAAMLNPKPGHTQFEKLQRGFVDAAGRLGVDALVLTVPPPDSLVWPLPAITLDENVRALVDRWQKHPAATRPTALFVPSDRTAVQLYGALRERGLRVPHDVSVISCNNETSLVSGLNPTVTTVDVQAEAVGRRAVEQLYWRIAHPDETLTTQVLVEPRLVVRHSVRRTG
jgi:DNA-binding LacI/PurR family transcriptional regulator